MSRIYWYLDAYWKGRERQAYVLLYLVYKKTLVMNR